MSPRIKNLVGADDIEALHLFTQVAYTVSPMPKRPAAYTTDHPLSKARVKGQTQSIRLPVKGLPDVSYVPFIFYPHWTYAGAGTITVV